MRVCVCSGGRNNIYLRAASNMAESSGTSLMQVTVNFEGARTVLHLPRDMKVGRAIQKAADHFKQDPSGLTFLYHGNVITDDMTVGVIVLLKRPT